MIKTRTTTEVQIPDTDIWFTPQVGPRPDPYDDVYVPFVGESFRQVSWLVRDDDAEPFEWDDPDTPPSGWINGVFRDFRNSHHGGGEEARDAFAAEMAELVGADRVFIVEVYSHGADTFAIVGTRHFPDRRWDVAPACVLAVPPDVTNPAEWASATIDNYNSWVNGDVWGVVFHSVDNDGRVLGCESLWGYVGRSYAEEIARSGDY